MLRFAEKNIDKIVIKNFNKQVDNLPRNIQDRWLLYSQYFTDMGMNQ